MSSPFQKKFIGKSPMHQTFSLDDLKKSSTKEDKDSLNNSRSGNVGAPGDPGTEINYNDPKRFAGDDEGMLKDDFEPQFAGDDGYEDQDLKKNSSPLDSYSNPGQVKYFSNKADFKALQETLTKSVDPETKAINQETRVNRRNDRIAKNPKLGKDMNTGKYDKLLDKIVYQDDDSFANKTTEIEQRAIDNRDIASKKSKKPGNNQALNNILNNCPTGTNWDGTKCN